MPNIVSRGIRGVLIAMLTLSAVIFYLPTVRTLLEGETYEWGFTLFGRNHAGAGLSGDLPVLLCLFALAVIAFIAAWRGPRRLAGLLMTVWFGLHAANAVAQLQMGERFLFRGDTLNAAADLTWLFVGLPAVAMLGALALAIAPGDRRERSVWTRANTVFTGLFVLILSAAAALLIYGTPHAQTDEWGVMLALANLLVANLALASWERRAAESG